MLTYYLATMVGMIIVSVTTVLFLMAYASYETTTEVTQMNILLETISYLFLTVGMYFFADNFVTKDTYQYLQLSRPKELRTYDGEDLSPEDAEKEPVSVYLSVL